MLLFCFCLSLPAFCFLSPLLILMCLFLSFLVGFSFLTSQALFFSCSLFKIPWPLVFVFSFINRIFNLKSNISISLKVSKDLTKELISDSICLCLIDVTAGAYTSFGSALFFFILFLFKFNLFLNVIRLLFTIT